MIGREDGANFSLTNFKMKFSKTNTCTVPDNFRLSIKNYSVSDVVRQFWFEKKKIQIKILSGSRSSVERIRSIEVKLKPK